ncbi:MAG: flagellar biosynthesis protein FlhA [Planctomycetes bacterium]|nr:flagellar biosynthesis protein FlhA [Planctomycetota bacterium]
MSTTPPLMGPLPITRHADKLLAFGMIVLLFVLLVPLPQFLLDVAITFNLAASLMVLLMTLTLKQPLEFSTFPSLLLFLTLFRLSLNVASTRLILMQGKAGDVIQAFGDFVVGGNLLIGVVIFAILMVVQFVVITKGSNRISEVAARFTLDAMPGKQMAIDADLNAGLIDETQARTRREAVSAEAEFYGAMDGAGKFVRGDAVAGLIIIAVNILGGIGIGISKDMGVMDALHKYAILTIGDGLVTQIPALIISIASGLLVTKARTKEKLSVEMVDQFLVHPAAMRLTATLILLVGLVPGIPLIPFIMLAGALFVVASYSDKAMKAAAAPKPAPEKAEPENAAELTPEALQDLLKVDRMGIEIGYRLIPLVNEQRRGNLLDHIAMVRKQFAQQHGFVVPPIRMRDNLTLEPNRYRVLVGGQEVGRGELYPEHVLAMNPGHVREKLQGIITKDPTFGLPATWIPVSRKSDAEMLGYTVVDPESVLVTHLTEIIKDHAHEILSREDVQAAVDRVKESNPTVVAELVPDIMNVGQIQRVLAGLLKERVPIRQLPQVLEVLADHGRTVKDPDQLTELVRARIARTLCEIYGRTNGRIEAITIAPQTEQMLMEAFGGDASGLGAVGLQQLQDGVIARYSEAQAQGRDPVLVVRAPLRRHLAGIFVHLKPPIPVLSYGEVVSAPGVDAVGVVQIQAQEPVTAANPTRQTVPVRRAIPIPA